MADVPGAVLAGRYELVSEIGRGAMGVVWRALDRQTGQPVAIKVLQAASLDDPEIRTRFDREAGLAARIQSRRVVRILDHGIEGDQPFIVMELVDGHSLREIMSAHGKYRWDEIRPLLITIARALSDSHAEGVIHRDVKPSNILITQDGSAKLADFGVARSFDQTRLTRTAATMGTPAYLAPEGSRDQRSDLYALGIVAYEMLAGRPPFVGDTPQEVLLSHLRTEPDLSKIPAESRKVIGWLLAKDPAMRPQSAEALIASLQAGDTGTVPMPMPARRGSSLVKVGALLFALVVVLVVAAVGVVGSGILTAKATATPAVAATVGDATPTAGITTAPVDTSGAQPTATPTAAGPTDTPTPAPPVATATPAVAGAWYVADWSTGLNGWSNSNGFDVRQGQLVNDGTGADDILSVQAPFFPPSANYAVEAKIQFVSGCDYGFGIISRWDGSGGGYVLNVEHCNFIGLYRADQFSGDGLASAPWNPAGIHTYRIEVLNAVISVFVDGKPILSVTDLRFPDAGKVGLRAASTQLIVMSFKVVPLT